jgi:DNA-binding cell septation regulator SpoVG
MSLKVTSVTSFPVTGAAKLKAKGKVVLNEVIELKYLIIDGNKGPFVSWEGTTTYDKKDGTGKGYNSPIFIKDKDLNDTVNKAIMDKFKGGASAPRTGNAQASSSPAVDSTFATDDIPF